MSADTPINAAQVQRRVAALASERMTLFAQAGGHDSAVAAKAQTRLGLIERELDECYMTLRQHRAIRDAQRFERDGIGHLRVPQRPASS